MYNGTWCGFLINADWSASLETTELPNWKIEIDRLKCSPSTIIIFKFATRLNFPHHPGSC